MIETSKVYKYKDELAEILSPVQQEQNEVDVQRQDMLRVPSRPRLFGQMWRFVLVGGLNTLVDLLILNSLLWLFPTTSAFALLAYNSLAYSVGAVNSFLLNKYWTFGHRQKTSRRELVSFTLTTLCGIGWSTIILWCASNVLHSFVGNATLWANASKVVAIAGTAFISFLGMRLWVFVSHACRG